MYLCGCGTSVVSHFSYYYCRFLYNFFLFSLLETQKWMCVSTFVRYLFWIVCVCVFTWKKQQRHKNNNSSNDNNDTNGFCVTPLLLVAQQKFKHATNVWHMRIRANEIDGEIDVTPTIFLFFFPARLIVFVCKFLFLFRCQSSFFFLLLECGAHRKDKRQGTRSSINFMLFFFPFFSFATWKIVTFFTFAIENWIFHSFSVFFLQIFSSVLPFFSTVILI